MNKIALNYARIKLEVKEIVVVELIRIENDEDLKGLIKKNES